VAYLVFSKGVHSKCMEHKPTMGDWESRGRSPGPGVGGKAPWSWNT